MPVFITRFAQFVHARVRGWGLSLVVAVFVFVTSWPAMWLVEPAANGITSPQNYWWWFLVTAATVGYGDFYPASAAGHVVGAYVIVGGIVALTILFTQLASYIQTVRGKRVKGSAGLDVSGHTVILGYTAGRTERIVGELGVEDRRDLVLCAWEEVTEHPMAEREQVAFVRGDLTSADVLGRACVDRAAAVLIDVRDDNETLTVAVAVDHVNPQVHLVAALREMDRCEHLRYVSRAVQCVQWHMPKLLTEEVLDPGITQVYSELMSSAGSGNTYSARLPESLSDSTFGQCQTHFGRHFGATVIAVRDADGLQVSPAWDAAIRGGSLLYYLAATRIDESRLAAAR